MFNSLRQRLRVFTTWHGCENSSGQSEKSVFWTMKTSESQRLLSFNEKIRKPTFTFKGKELWWVNRIFSFNVPYSFHFRRSLRDTVTLVVFTCDHPLVIRSQSEDDCVIGSRIKNPYELKIIIKISSQVRQTIRSLSILINLSLQVGIIYQLITTPSLSTVFPIS